MIRNDYFDKLSVIDNTINCDFYKSIDCIRNNLYSYEYNYINKTVTEYQKFDFKGRFDIEVDKILLQCFFVDNGSNSICVTFDGARSTEQINNDPYCNNPFFSRWSYYPLFDGSFLCIEDPMYRIYRGLRLGWYYGDKNCIFIENIIKLVKNIIKVKNIKNNKVIFFSSSGGGMQHYYLQY